MGDAPGSRRGAPEDVPAPTRVLLVQPHSLVRQGMLRVLEGLEGFEVVAHTGSTDEGLKLAGDLRPDVVIVDADLPEQSAVDLCSAVKPLLGGGRVLLVAEEAAPSHVERALSAGADGYLLKEVTVEEFAEAIRLVASGEVAIHPAAASALASGYAAAARGQRMPELTPRQREILELLAEGLGNKQIARRLGIGTHTVKTHVSRILHKLDVTTRTEAVVVAMKDRLIG